MTTPSGNPGSLREQTWQACERMRAVAAALAERGIEAEITSDCGGVDLTARMLSDGERTAEVVYAEEGPLDWQSWGSRDDDPAQIADTIARGLAAITPAA
jgi:hypothetical protein